MGINIAGKHAAEILGELHAAGRSERKTDVGAWPAKDIRELVQRFHETTPILVLPPRVAEREWRGIPYESFHENAVLVDRVLAAPEFQNSRTRIQCDPTTFDKFGILETIGNSGNYKRADVVKRENRPFADFIEFVMLP